LNNILIKCKEGNFRRETETENKIKEYRE